MARTDYSDHVSEHRSPGMRLLFLLLGSICVILGLIGVFVPLLPSTPFILLAAACYARASIRFYNGLLNTPAFGPAILEWRLHRSIPYRTKLVAIAAMAATLTVSVLAFVESTAWRAAWALLGLLLAFGLFRIPSRNGPRRAGR